MVSKLLSNDPSAKYQLYMFCLQIFSPSRPSLLKSTLDVLQVGQFSFIPSQDIGGHLNF